MEIIFIPGKWIGTKDKDSKVLTMHFIVPADFNHRNFINKPLMLTIPIPDGESIDTPCYLSDIWSNYYYSPNHWTYAIKLEVTLPDLLLTWYILKAQAFELRLFK